MCIYLSNPLPRSVAVHCYRDADEAPDVEEILTCGRYGVLTTLVDFPV